MDIRKVLVLVFDYFLTLGKNAIIDVILPILIAIISFYLIKVDLLNYDKNIIGDILTVLGIISGFGISSISLLLSSNNESIKNYKKTFTKHIVDGEEISLFRRLYILISYSTVVSFIGILIFFIGGLVQWNKFCLTSTVNFFKALSIGYISHILITNIRSITSIYLIFVNETNVKP